MSTLRCGQCSVKFESRDLLAMHMLDHSFSVEESNSKGKAATIFQRNGRLGVTAVSGGADPIEANLQDVCNRQNTSKCEICQEVFSDRDSLAMHTLSHANEQNSYQEAGRAESHPCTFCGMVFSYEDMLLLHIVSRHKQMGITKVPLDLSLKPPTSGKRQFDAISNFISPRDKLLSPRSSPRVLFHSATPIHRRLAAASRILVAMRDPSQTAETHITTKSEPQSPTNHTMDDEYSPSGVTTNTSMTSPTSSWLRTYSSDSSAAGSAPTIITNGKISISKYKNSHRDQSMKMDALPPLANVREAKSDDDTHKPVKTGDPLHSVKMKLLSNADALYFCTHCNIIFLDRAMYHLHAGLHNCNSPLQCNICGKVCSSPLEFSAHIIHT